MFSLLKNIFTTNLKKLITKENTTFTVLAAPLKLTCKV